MHKRNKIDTILANMQVREDRAWAKRLAIVKQGVAQAEFIESEMAALEDIVFRAFGRTKLR